MAELVWDEVGERVYEAGVDHGVLYPDGSDGVAWNGLISVTESIAGGESTSLYFDGVKYNDHVASEDFEATIEAFTYPDEFAECDGSYEIAPGLEATKQTRKGFGLSYRTKIGNDIDGQDHGFKIHLVYGCVASPSARAYKTLDKGVDPLNFVWAISATPEPLSPAALYKPTAHFVIDSRRIIGASLIELENKLYGTETTAPILPEQSYVVGLLSTLLLDTLDGGTPSFTSPDIVDGNQTGADIIDGGTP